MLRDTQAGARDRWGFLYRIRVVYVSENKIMSRKEASVQAYSRIKFCSCSGKQRGYEGVSEETRRTGE